MLDKITTLAHGHVRIESTKRHKNLCFIQFFVKMTVENFVCQFLSEASASDDVARALRTSTWKVLSDYRDRFEGLINMVDISDVKQSFIGIVERMFADGIVSRGRIITSFAFATLLLHRFKIDLVPERLL